MKDQADNTKRLADNSSDQVSQLKGQLGTMRRQLAFIQTESQAEQRAWVRPTYTIPGIISGIARIDNAVVHVQNSGKSPSLRNVVNARFEIVDATSDPPFSFTGTHTVDDIAILFPAPEPDIGTDTRVPLSPNGSISAADLNRLLDGHAYVVLWGMLAYADQFGEHWQMFCAWRDYATRNADAIFRADSCVRFNRVGDGKPPIPEQITAQHPN